MPLYPLVTHPWDVSPGEARAIQKALRQQVVIEPLTQTPRCVAGVDVSIRGGWARAAVVLMDYPGLRPLEAALATLPVHFPYVPGLLAFREGPAVLEALATLEGRPDLLLFDAQGLAHPRRIGLATHMGVLLGIPTVGCAKSRLVGTHEAPPVERGAWRPLLDGEEVIGAVVRTRGGVKPLFVSVGHRVDLPSAVALVLGCCSRYRLPEPTRWAHRVAGGARLPGL